VYAVTENPTFKQYTTSMQYDPITETRLVGGTSMATPHVGAAAAILHDSGITEPMLIKALLINSADTWTDQLTPHQAIGGSKWNRTYGWGYLNMNQAFEQRENLYQINIQPNETVCYQGDLRAQDKVTLVWKKHLHDPFTPMRLELYERISEVLVDEDDSLIDNVLQVSSYPDDLRAGLIRISNVGNKDETVALASGRTLSKSLCKP
jgi:serine protease AprX